jgi:hypothetical protein
VVAFVNMNGDVEAANADHPRRTAVIRTEFPPRGLAWDPSGRRLVAALTHGVSTFASRGPAGTFFDLGNGVIAALAVSPAGRRYAYVRTENGRSVLETSGYGRGGAREIFAGPGDFGGVEWSPDARWLLLDWDSADQWLFVPATGARRSVAVANITADFGRNARIDGWCCP